MVFAIYFKKWDPDISGQQKKNYWIVERVFEKRRVFSTENWPHSQRNYQRYGRAISQQGGVGAELVEVPTHFHRIKKIQKCKINYDGLTFSSSFLVIEEVKDEMWKHNGRSWVSIQVWVNFIMFMEEFASLVLNTIFLFSQLTQLEQINRRNTFILY